MVISITKNPTPFIYLHKLLKTKIMIISALFTGTDSLGYEKWKEYKLKISDTQGISIKRLDNSGKCIYQSLSAFLKNWNNITVLP